MEAMSFSGSRLGEKKSKLEVARLPSCPTTTMYESRPSDTNRIRGTIDIKVAVGL